MGIGNAVSEFVASLFAGGDKAYTSVTGHPAMIAHRSRSALWEMTRKPSKVHRMGKGASLKHLKKTMSVSRFTAGFRYVGPARPGERERLAERHGPGKRKRLEERERLPEAVRLVEPIRQRRG